MLVFIQMAYFYFAYMAQVMYTGISTTAAGLHIPLTIGGGSSTPAAITTTSAAAILPATTTVFAYATETAYFDRPALLHDPATTAPVTHTVFLPLDDEGVAFAVDTHPTSPLDVHEVEKGWFDFKLDAWAVVRSLFVLLLLSLGCLWVNIKFFVPQSSAFKAALIEKISVHQTTISDLQRRNARLTTRNTKLVGDVKKLQQPTPTESKAIHQNQATFVKLLRAQDELKELNIIHRELLRERKSDGAAAAKQLEWMNRHESNADKSVQSARAERAAAQEQVIALKAQLDHQVKITGGWKDSSVRFQGEQQRGAFQSRKMEQQLEAKDRQIHELQEQQLEAKDRQLQELREQVEVAHEQAHKQALSKLRLTLKNVTLQKVTAEGELEAEKATVAKLKVDLATEQGKVAKEQANVALEKANVLAEKAIAATEQANVLAEKGKVTAEEDKVKVEKAKAEAEQQKTAKAIAQGKQARFLATRGDDIRVARQRPSPDARLRKRQSWEECKEVRDLLRNAMNVDTRSAALPAPLDTPMSG